MKHSYLAIFLLAAILFSCSDSAVNPSAGATDEKIFVWNGMNQWYFWQENVPDLADDRFSGNRQFYSYLEEFQDERALFNSLLFVEDDFSWFIDDYEVHEQSRQGISRSFGFRYGLVRIGSSNDLFGYVQYVVPGSPADDAGLARGDIFTRINGTRLTLGNYINLLNSESYTLGLASITGNSISDRDETKSMTSVVLQENPVHKAEVLDAGNKRVGYLLLNAFRFNFHEEVNAAFGLFAQEQVDELVLDLRYNGGGALVTSAALAGMISGLDESLVFASLIHNEKRKERNSDFPFFDRVPVYNSSGSFQEWVTMNSLGLDRVYVLTSRSTASASETLINGLRPFMEVIQIGDETVGKDEGSITVYDSPPGFSSRQNANTSHKRAMQPIVFKIFNSQMEDYPGGFAPFPENRVREIDFLENLPPLGSMEEPLLARAIELITGDEPIAKQRIAPVFEGRLIFESDELVPLSRETYLLPAEVTRDAQNGLSVHAAGNRK
jgi:carboxyl-terminal processing protease